MLDTINLHGKKYFSDRGVATSFLAQLSSRWIEESIRLSDYSIFERQRYRIGDYHSKIQYGEEYYSRKRSITTGVVHILAAFREAIV